MKKNWSNPDVKNLNVCNTKESSCPAATGEKHGFGPLPDCTHYCAVCGGCKLKWGEGQLLCPANIVNPINKCKGNHSTVPPLS